MLSAELTFQLQPLKLSLYMRTQLCQSQGLLPQTLLFVSQEILTSTQSKLKESTQSKAVLQLYLHINKQLPQVAWRHHDSGVQLDDVAFIQRYVMISCQTLCSKQRD